VGSALLLIIAIAVLKLSVKLPIKPFFSVTGVLLLLLAFKLMGVGIHEFQEAGMISMTLWPAIPENDVLQQVFGIYPTAETILSQIVMLLALGVTFAISHWSWRRSGTVIEGAS
jgi:high-affinity iron transporter